VNTFLPATFIKMFAGELRPPIAVCDEVRHMIFRSIVCFAVFAAPYLANAQARIVSKLPSKAQERSIAGFQLPASRGETFQLARSLGSLPSKKELMETFTNTFFLTNNGTPIASVPFNADLSPLGCKLAASAPAGMPLVVGGLNGTATILECPSSVVVLYYFNYRLKTTETVTFVDPGYASDPERYRLRVKAGRVLYENGFVNYIRWLNPNAEAKAEIYEYGADKTVHEKVYSIISDFAKVEVDR